MARERGLGEQAACRANNTIVQGNVLYVLETVELQTGVSERDSN